MQISAFARKGTLVVHILNTGPERAAVISGLPDGSWHSVTTTETSGYHEATVKIEQGAASQKLLLPAHKLLVTLVRE